MILIGYLPSNPPVYSTHILLSIPSVPSWTQFFKPEKAASVYLRMVGVNLQTYMVLKPRGLSCDQYQLQKP